MIRYIWEEENNRAAAYDGEKLVGICSFYVEDGNWVADHTKTDPEYGGRGIAKELVSLLVESAKKKGVKIVPVCSYVVHQFEKNEEYKEIQV